MLLRLIKLDIGLLESITLYDRLPNLLYSVELSFGVDGEDPIKLSFVFYFYDPLFLLLLVLITLCVVVTRSIYIIYYKMAY